MTDLYNECDFDIDSLDEHELEELMENYETIEDLCIVHLSFLYEDGACLWATQEHDFSADIEGHLTVRSVRGNEAVEEALVALHERRERLGLDPTDPTTYPNYRQPKEAGAGGITPLQKAMEPRYFEFFDAEPVDEWAWAAGLEVV